MYVYMYVCMYVCKYVYMFKDKDPKIYIVMTEHDFRSRF